MPTASSRCETGGSSIRRTRSITIPSPSQPDLTMIEMKRLRGSPRSVRFAAVQSGSRHLACGCGAAGARNSTRRGCSKFVQMRGQIALLACSGVALILVVLVPVSPSAASGRNSVRVGLFGDSLAVQAEPYFNLLLQAGGKAKVNDFAYGGTAACDWLPKMRRYARTEHPQGSGVRVRRKHVHGLHEGLSLRIAGRGGLVLLGDLVRNQGLPRIRDSRLPDWCTDHAVPVARP